MPITTDLRENGHVIYLTITDPWDVMQYVDSYPKQKELLDHAAFTVHTVLDFTASRHMPDNLLRARNNPNIKHPKSGYYLLVGLTSFGQTIAQTMVRLVRFDRMKLFPTSAEALNFLQKAIAEENNGIQVQPTENVTK